MQEDQVKLLFICENLRRLRLAHGLTYTKVAEILNKTRQAYVNYENGLRHITIIDLMAIAEFYNVSLDMITGNPYHTKNVNELKFTTYTLDNGEIKKTFPITISTILDDVIVLKQNDLRLDFFWKSNYYQKNHVMLFEYFDKVYQSKVYYHKDGSGSFFINDDMITFTKTQAESIFYLGIHLSHLTKEFNIDNFF